MNHYKETGGPEHKKSDYNISFYRIMFADNVQISAPTAVVCMVCSTHTNTVILCTHTHARAMLRTPNMN